MPTGKPHDDSDVVKAEYLLERRDLGPALEAYEQAELLGADSERCSAGRWMIHMLRGDFERAWIESDRIRARGAPDPHRLWDGTCIDGKRVIVRCLHGFGDAVQMLRFAPLLRNRAGSLAIEVPPRLLQLAPLLDGVDDVITWGEHAPLQPPEWDVQVEVMELPYLFRLSSQQLPVTTNYLHVPDGAGTSLPSVSCKIGIVWAAGKWNAARSLPFQYVRAIVTNIPGEFWNLQGGEDRVMWSELDRSPALHDADELGDGILNLAASIRELDLVITVDTLAAHLAGAMGKPAWVLLQYAADWRWMTERIDSPWYPSLKLYRQQRPGDWAGVVGDLLRDLKHWLWQCDRGRVAG